MYVHSDCVWEKIETFYFVLEWRYIVAYSKMTFVLAEKKLKWKE
jgi:hypothetical protein